MAGDELRADVPAIFKYSTATAALSGDLADVQSALARTLIASQHGFADFSGGDVFAGGTLMNSVTQDTNAQFMQFLQDVGQGLQAIGNAAMVCADAYRGADAQAADGIGLVDFAFADPAATRPPGLSAGIGATMADRAAPAVTVVSTAGRDDHTETVYSDGTTTVVDTTVGAQRPAILAAHPVGPVSTSTRTQTTTTDATGAVVSTTTRSYVAWTGGGSAVVDEGPLQRGTKGRTVTATITAPDGGVSVVTTGPDQPTEVETLPASEPASREEGPVEQATGELDPQQLMQVEQAVHQPAGGTVTRAAPGR